MQFGSALYRSEAQAIAYAVKYMDVNRPNASAGRHHVPLCGRSIYERRMATQLDDFFPAQWDDAPELHSVVSSDNPVENGVAIAPVRPDFSHITNADFIAAVVQQPPEGASAAVCSKPGDPSDGGWRAVPFDKLAEPLPVTANNYFNCASFRPGQDGFKARKENFAATHFIMLDDIGSKVPVDRLQEDDHGFEACETVVVHEPHPQQDQKKIAPHPLGKYSISDDIEALERQMVEQVPLLGNIALMGQATAIFAAPNTGKTLLTLRLLTDAIDKKSFDPKKVFYLNMDDNSKGLVEKVKIASEYGFEMLADGYKGFQSSDFRKAMEIMIENGTARGVAIVIDTLKKFTDTMDKGRSTDFSKVIRRFCLQGGTVIALGHTNKNPGANGKKVYAGTTDIVDDFDCAYILDTLKVQPEPGWKVVEFENIKRRGNVEETVAYRYRNEPGTRYDAMLLSVKEEDYSSLLQLKETAEIQSDMPVIVAIRDAIAEGINSKMKLIKAVSKAVALSERIVIGILEKYTGENPANHHWQFVVGARGAKTYALLGQDGEVVA